MTKKKEDLKTTLKSLLQFFLIPVFALFAKTSCKITVNVIRSFPQNHILAQFYVDQNHSTTETH